MFSSLRQTGTPGYQKACRITTLQEDLTDNTLFELMYDLFLYLTGKVYFSEAVRNPRLSESLQGYNFTRTLNRQYLV